MVIRFLKKPSGLANDHSPYYTGQIGNPALRQAAIDQYITTVKNSLGIDDGSLAYQKRLRSALKTLDDVATAENIARILPGLATAIEAQPDCAFLIEETWKSIGLNSLMGKEAAGKYGEFFTNEVSNDPDARARTIDFLMQPVTHQTANDYLESIKNLARRSRNLTKDVETAFYSQTGDVQEQGSFAATEFHKNFGMAPLEAQIVYFEKLLFPIQQSNEAEQLETIQKVIDRVLPESPELIKQKGFDVRSAEIARVIVKSYIGAADLPEQRLLATLIMVADANGIAQENRSVGRILHLALSKMPPAGPKLLQAIHSNQHTPQILRKELDGCKSENDIPLRPDVIRLVETSEALDPPGGRMVTHIGPVRGGGSMVVGVENTLDDGSRVIDRNLRNYIAQKAKREFQNISKALEVAIKDKPELAIVREMVDEARRSVQIEADHRVWRVQNASAETIL